MEHRILKKKWGKTKNKAKTCHSKYFFTSPNNFMDDEINDFFKSFNYLSRTHTISSWAKRWQAKFKFQGRNHFHLLLFKGWPAKQTVLSSLAEHSQSKPIDVIYRIMSNLELLMTNSTPSWKNAYLKLLCIVGSKPFPNSIEQ